MRRNRAVEAGRSAGEPHVAREGEVHAGTDGGTVHRGDRRQRRTQHAEKSFVDRHDRAALAIVGVRRRERPEARNVGAAAEGRRLAGEHDRADLVVRFEPVERLDDLEHHRARHRVAALLVDERDRSRRRRLRRPERVPSATPARTTADECRKKSRHRAGTVRRVRVADRARRGAVLGRTLRRCPRSCARSGSRRA